MTLSRPALLPTRLPPARLLPARLLPARLLLAACLLSAPLPGLAADTAAHAHDHAHEGAHDHAHDHDSDAIYRGYFEDAQVAARPLSDWAGEWQSVYPLLQSGALDGVMAAKAAKGDKSAADYRAYYEAGYRTDVARIVIRGESVSFDGPKGTVSGQYASDGHEVLTYAAGNRGVRYVFRKTGGDAAAPGFIQFSDHGIAPAKAGHYHLYWGDDRAALLAEVSHWPTYYPAAMSGPAIAEEMLAH